MVCIRVRVGVGVRSFVEKRVQYRDSNLGKDVPPCNQSWVFATTQYIVRVASSSFLLPQHHVHIPLLNISRPTE